MGFFFENPKMQFCKAVALNYVWLKKRNFTVVLLKVAIMHLKFAITMNSFTYLGRLYQKYSRLRGLVFLQVWWYVFHFVWMIITLKELKTLISLELFLVCLVNSRDDTTQFGLNTSQIFQFHYSMQLFSANDTIFKKQQHFLPLKT